MIKINLTTEEALERTKALLNPNNELTIGRLLEIQKGSPPTPLEVTQLLLLNQRDYNFRFTRPHLKKIKKSRSKVEGGLYSEELGCYCYWRTRGHKARQIRERKAVREAKLRKLYNKDPNHPGRAYNKAVAQGDQFGETLFPTITISSADYVSKPFIPRPDPWYWSPSYLRRQRKKGN